MSTVYFLEASVPLTKSFRQNSDNTIEKSSYPLIATFTSHKEEVTDIGDLYKAIMHHSKLGHCLIKGPLNRPLVRESRAGSTTTTNKTNWICLDFDRFKCSDLDKALGHMGLGDVSYILQYSASQGVYESDAGTISAHVFMMLNMDVAAPDLKNWLINMNFKTEVLCNNLKMNRVATSLRWPLDITTCQNDKLLYIAPPTFVSPLVDPLGTRITFHRRKSQVLDFKKELKTLPTRASLREVELFHLNSFRKAQGLKPRRDGKPAYKNGVEIFSRPDVARSFEVKEQGEYIRLNINGGDSWAYSHHKDNFEIIHDFKTDYNYLTKDFLPDYYKLKVDELRANTLTPTDKGDLILGFRNVDTAEYMNGIWNESTGELKLHTARNERQIEDWYKTYGRPRMQGDPIPPWTVRWLPREDWTVDVENQSINLFKASEYMRVEPKALQAGNFPNILGIIYHMLGCTQGNDDDDALVMHFLNWFAAIFQRKHKPLTAWVCHGIEGTGKGYFANKIAGQLLGTGNWISVVVSNVEDSFNGWLEKCLFVLVDEVDVDDFREKGRVTARLRNYITEPTITSRRMRQQAQSVPNYASFMFSSNRPQPVFIPASDRRYNVGNFQNKRLPRPDDDVIDAELMAFAQYLQAFKVDIKASNAIMHTEARQRISDMSVNSMEETIKIIREGNFEALWLSMPDESVLNLRQNSDSYTDDARLFANLMKDLGHEILSGAEGKISRDEIGIILQWCVASTSVRPNKLKALLGHHNIELRRLRRRGILTYGYEVDWKIDPEFRAELSQSLGKSKPSLRKVK